MLESITLQENKGIKRRYTITKGMQRQRVCIKNLEANTHTRIDTCTMVNGCAIPVDLLRI